MQMECIATCYMPVIRDDEKVQHRFEEGDVVDVPESKVKQFQKTGNFVAASQPVENPIYVEEPEEPPEETEESEEEEEPEEPASGPAMVAEPEAPAEEEPEASGEAEASAESEPEASGEAGEEEQS